MKRYIFILTMVLLPLLSCTRSELPNIVFILADDMGFGDPGCYNPDSKIPSPHIDALAQSGMRFTNAHAPAAWCTPSRYGLLTGKYPARVNIASAGKQCLIEENQVNLASLLKSGGYYTACIGKWHLGFDSVNFGDKIMGGPVDRGFDYYYGIPVSLDIPPYYYIENDKCVAAPTIPIDASNTEGVSVVQGAFWRKGLIAPGFRHQDVLPDLTDKALMVLKRHFENQEKQPLFLYFPLPAPHTPWLPAEEFRGTSNAGMYGDFMVQVDYTIGKIIKTLDECGQREKTLVFFSSDNGPVWFDEDIERYDHRSTYFLKGMKSDMWEGGHRMPFIVSWPGHIKQAATSGSLICFTDVLATLADITEIEINTKNLDSHSILPILKGDLDKEVREFLIIDRKAIITPEWKYIDGHGGDGFNRAYSLSKERFMDLPQNMGELYRIDIDPTESNNLYYNNPAKASALKTKLDSIIVNK